MDPQPRVQPLHPCLTFPKAPKALRPCHQAAHSTRSGFTAGEAARAAQRLQENLPGQILLPPGCRASSQLIAGLGCDSKLPQSLWLRLGPAQRLQLSPWVCAEELLRLRHGKSTPGSLHGVRILRSSTRSTRRRSHKLLSPSYSCFGNFPSSGKAWECFGAPEPSGLRKRNNCRGITDTQSCCLTHS